MTNQEYEEEDAKERGWVRVPCNTYPTRVQGDLKYRLQVKVQHTIIGETSWWTVCVQCSCCGGLDMLQDQTTALELTLVS